jgi:hypothetical protein
MTTEARREETAKGTIQSPRYEESPAFSEPNVDDDVCLRGRIFTYGTEAGLVAGSIASVMFTIDRPAKEVWPYFKNLNLWQKNMHYSGVVGDLEGKIYTTSEKPNDVDSPYRRQVVRVIPEHVIVTSALMPKDDAGWPALPGVGGVCPGFSVFMLSEQAGRTVVTIVMQHASYASRRQDMTVDEALAPWREEGGALDWQQRWRNEYIPALKKLIYQGRRV